MPKEARPAMEKSEDYQKLFTAYYIATLDHFFAKIQEPTRGSPISILHLCQVPGDQFRASEITEKLFINTIYVYLHKNKELLDKITEDFRISIDSDIKNIIMSKEVYNNYLNLQDIKTNEYLIKKEFPNRFLEYNSPTIAAFMAP